MAFNREGAINVGTTPVDVYTAPASNEVVTIGINLANVHTSQIYVTLQHVGTGNTINLIKDVPIPAGSSLSPLDGKINLVAGDILRVSSDTENSVDVLISVLEQVV